MSVTLLIFCFQDYGQFNYWRTLEWQMPDQIWLSLLGQSSCFSPFTQGNYLARPLHPPVSTLGWCWVYYCHIKNRVPDTSSAFQEFCWKNVQAILVTVWLFHCRNKMSPLLFRLLFIAICVCQQYYWGAPVQTVSDIILVSAAMLVWKHYPQYILGIRTIQQSMCCFFKLLSCGLLCLCVTTNVLNAVLFYFHQMKTRMQRGQRGS